MTAAILVLNAGSSSLKFALFEAANARHGPCLTHPGGRTKAWAIPTDEELVIARHTRALVGT